MNRLSLLIIAFCQIAVILGKDVNIDSEKKFTGARLTIEKAVLECNIIIIGQFTTLGTPSGDASGETHFDNANFVVRKVLVGHASETIKVSYIVQEINGQAGPGIGINYILFIRTTNPGEFEIIKLLEATPDVESRTLKAYQDASWNK